MTVSLTAVELLWITTNLVTAILTIGALIEARRDWAALKRFNGSTRGVVARANIRSEWIRLAIQVALLAIAVPAVFSARETPLTPGLLIFLSVPLLLLLNSFNARRLRVTLAHKLEDEIQLERDASLAKLRIDLNADADIRAANLDKRADERAGIAHDQAEGHAEVVTVRADAIKVTADETAVEVHDIHDATVPPGKKTP